MQAQGCRLTARVVQNLLALSERPALGAAPVAGCWECQKRFKSKSKRRPFTLREDDLIQRALDDEFGSANIYKDLKREPSVVDNRVKARIDDAWHAVTLRNSHISGRLVAMHGLEKTGEDVFERGRRAVIYYECNPGSEAYVATYFQTARKWLGHQLGEAMHLKTRPRFDFVHDGLSPQAEALLEQLTAATRDNVTEAATAPPTGDHEASSDEEESAKAAPARVGLRRRPRPSVDWQAQR